MQSDRKIRYLYRKKPYVYFRAPDGSLTRLPSDERSAEFKRCYAACLKSINAAGAAAPAIVPKSRVGFTPESIGAGIEVYLASSDFAAKKPGTQYNYRRALDILRDELGCGLLCDLDTEAVDIYSERITMVPLVRPGSTKPPKPFGAAAADMQVALISNIWQACKKYPQFRIRGKANPAVDAEKRYTVKAPHKPWDDAAEILFMETAPANLRLAKLLLHFSGQRGGDCIKMKWSDFDGRGLVVTPEKTDSNAQPEPNYHLCPRPLRDALLAAPHEAETILVNAFGTPYGSASTLSHAIRRHLIKLGLAKRGTKTLVMHGLRKNAASDVASLGVGTSGIKSIGGWRSNGMADYYAAHANKRRINANVVELWDREIERENVARAGAIPRRKRQVGG